MFRWLGSLAVRFRYVIITGWIIGATALIVTAPPLEEVATADQRDFLPADAPFVQAQAVFEAVFPEEFSASSTVILVDAGAGGSVRDAAIWAYMEQAAAYLNSPEAPENVGEVASPTDDPLLADALIAPDGQIALISAAITTPTDAKPTAESV